MNGFHDLGGFQGFGQVAHRIDSLSYKPVFKEDWEHLAYSLMFVACDHLGLFSIDEVRHAVERLDVRQHVGTTYYERYVIATASLLVEAGAIDRQALDDALGAPFKLANPPHSQGRPAIGDRPPFEVGERVRVRDEHFAGHVRFPGYVRGKEGIVLHRTRERWPFPDSIGHGDRSALLQPTYHVQFEVRDLWGEAADHGQVVVDLFESYLDPVVAR